MKSCIGLHLVGLIVVLRETTARAADIPVWEIVDKWEDAFQGLWNVVFGHSLGDFVTELVHTGEDPEVERMLRVELQIVTIDAVDGSVSREEVIDIPEHRELAVDVGDVFIKQSEVFARENRARKK